MLCTAANCGWLLCIVCQLLLQTHPRQESNRKKTAGFEAVLLLCCRLLQTRRRQASLMMTFWALSLATRLTRCCGSSQIYRWAANFGHCTAWQLIRVFQDASAMFLGHRRGLAIAISSLSHSGTGFFIPVLGAECCRPLRCQILLSMFLLFSGGPWHPGYPHLQGWPQRP